MSHVLENPPEGSALLPIHGNRGLPYLGFVRQYIADPLALWKRRHAQYGPVSWHGNLGKKFVVALGPDACETVLTNRDKAYSNRLGWRFVIGPFFDNGLMLLDFDEHRQHRRLLQQAFTKVRLTGYAQRLAPAIADAVQDWQPGADFEVYPATKALTLGLATEIFMGGSEGVDRERMDRVNRAFIDCVQAATSMVRIPVPGGRWYRGLRGRRYLEDFLREYLPARRAGNGDDLFSVLCRVQTETGEYFGDDEIIDHMIFLLMAAHDTSTLTISTMVRYLGQNPDWQNRCREESLRLGDATLDSPATQLPSLDLVMKESLRLLAPLPAMVRRTVKDTQIDGHFVPSGAFVLATPHFTHHMKELWPDPEKFDPRRFDSGRSAEGRHKYAWQPFGGGVHTCLGQFFAGIEISLVLHHLLTRFEWSVPADYETPVDFTSLPFPKDGQPVELRRRSVGAKSRDERSAAGR